MVFIEKRATNGNGSPTDGEMHVVTAVQETESADVEFVGVLPTEVVSSFYFVIETGD